MASISGSRKLGLNHSELLQIYYDCYFSNLKICNMTWKDKKKGRRMWTRNFIMKYLTLRKISCPGCQKGIDSTLNKIFWEDKAEKPPNKGGEYAQEDNEFS